VLGETYYHSLAFVYSKPEFKKQVKLHSKTIELLFGVTPRVLRNTELIYQNELADLAHELGFHGVLAEGAQKILGGRSPHFVYTNHTGHMPLLLKDYQLSDDIAFRFSDKNWCEHPLTVDTYFDWINRTHGNGSTINLFMDYETFGEHQWASTGIFDFLDHLPDKILERSDNQFSTPSDIIAHHCPVDRVDVPYYTSWADTDRDLSAWLGNDLQTTAAHALYELEPIINTIDDEALAHNWRKLQTSDHVYYMCTKWFNDGDVHAYFNPYDSPYDGFLYFMNSVHNLKRQLHEHRTDHHSSSRSRNEVSPFHKSSCQGNDSTT
jgi:alpha-amylase